MRFDNYVPGRTPYSLDEYVGYTYLKEGIWAGIQLSFKEFLQFGGGLGEEILLLTTCSQVGPLACQLFRGLKPISPVKIGRSNEIPQIWLTSNLLYRFHFKALRTCNCRGRLSFSLSLSQKEFKAQVDQPHI